MLATRDERKFLRQDTADSSPELRLSKYAITAAPSALTDAMGTVRSRRHASTAPRRPPLLEVE